MKSLFKKEINKLLEALKERLHIPDYSNIVEFKKGVFIIEKNKTSFIANPNIVGVARTSDGGMIAFKHGEFIDEEVEPLYVVYTKKITEFDKIVNPVMLVLNLNENK